MNAATPSINVVPLRKTRLHIAPKLRTMLLLAVILAVVGWLIAYAARIDGRLLVWDDVRSTFADPALFFWNPYDVGGFHAMPYANILLLPFDELPLQWAALCFTLLYFSMLAAVIYKFGGGVRALLIALTSVLALDTALEINIDWMVCIGLLVPRPFSIPFLLIKPQSALGYVLSFSRRDFVRATIFTLIVFIGTFLVWGFWIEDLFLRVNETNMWVNLAPRRSIPPVVAYLLGAALLIYAFRKRDPILCIVGGLFFVPYISPNSALIAASLLSVRFPRIALIVSVVAWLLVLQIAIPYFNG